MSGQFQTRSNCSSPQDESNRGQNERSHHPETPSGHTPDDQRTDQRQRWILFLAHQIAMDILRARAVKEGGQQ